MTLCCTRKILTVNRRMLDAFFKEHPQAVLGAVFNPVFIRWQIICTKRGRSWQDLWDMTFYTKIQELPEKPVEVNLSSSVNAQACKAIVA